MAAEFTIVFRSARRSFHAGPAMLAAIAIAFQQEGCRDDDETAGMAFGLCRRPGRHNWPGNTPTCTIRNSDIDMTEAARAVLTYAWDNLGADFLCSIVHPDNAASHAVAGRVHSHRREYVERDEPRLLFYTDEKDRIVRHETGRLPGG